MNRNLRKAAGAAKAILPKNFIKTYYNYGVHGIDAQWHATERLMRAMETPRVSERQHLTIAAARQRKEWPETEE